MTTTAFKTITFAPNVTIFREGDKADCAYIIKKGSVKITKRSPSGKNIPIATAESGGIVGEMAIVSDAPRSASVVTQEEVVVLAVSKQSFETRLKEIDPFLHSLIKTVIARLRKTSSHTVALFERAKTRQKENAQPQTNSLKKSDTTKASFKNVHFLLADPNSQTRNSLRGGLFSFGFREINDVSSYEQLQENIEKNHYDLLILDTSFGMQRIHELIQDIRHGRKCKNPFMSILIMSENNKPRFLESLLHMGADKALAKPISIANITEAIQEMCIKRSAFVVTHDYIGPDRIGFKDHFADDAPSFDAPNTMAQKALRGLNQDKVVDHIETGLINLNEIKMERHMVQIAWLLDRLNPENGVPLNMDFILDQAEEVLADLSWRAQNSRYEEATRTCNEMRELALNLKNDQAPQQDKWHGMSDCFNDLLDVMPLIAKQGPHLTPNMQTAL